VQVIVQALEQALAEIHIANWIDSLREINAARHLSVPVSPVMLDSFHVPLIHNDNNLFTLSIVNLSEQVLVSLINNDLFHLGEESGC